MSRNIAMPAEYEDNVIQLFKSFLQNKQLHKISDVEYYHTVSSFFKSIIKLESYHQFWRKEEDSVPFESMLILLMRRSLEQASFKQEQIEQIVSWLMDKRFIIMLTLLQHWSASEIGRMQLNKLIHHQYDKDQAQRNLLDNSYIPAIVTILHKRLIAYYVENSSFSNDIVGLLMSKSKKEAARFLNLIRIDALKLLGFFQRLEDKRSISVLDITQDSKDFVDLELSSEAVLIKAAHRAMSEFVIEDLNDPCKRVITFMISVYEKNGALDNRQWIEQLLWETPFVGFSDVVTGNKALWIQDFLKELLSTLYFLIMPGELPKSVFNELCVTFAGAPVDDFEARLREFKQDNSFKILLRGLLVLVPKEHWSDFDKVVKLLAGILCTQKSFASIPQEVAIANDEDALASIQGWLITVEPIEALTAVIHQGIDLNNVRFCDTKAEEKIIILERQKKAEMRLAIEEKQERGDSLSIEEALLLNENRLNNDMIFDLRYQAQEESRNEYCLRKKTEVYHIGEAIARVEVPGLLELRELYDTVEQEVSASLFEERKKQDSLRLQETRTREDSFRGEGFKAGMEAHRKIIRSRLVKIGFGILAAVGIGLLVYLSIQTWGALPAAIALAIALKPFWISGAVSTGVGIVGAIGQYGRDRGWFAKKPAKQARLTQKKSQVVKRDPHAVALPNKSTTLVAPAIVSEPPAPRKSSIICDGASMKVLPDAGLFADHKGGMSDVVADHEAEVSYLKRL